ncbi:MAG: ECF transporter S component [Oscillospiraceae bacterium]|nr:ECF transporter S component [Oscillospiraceae bacterium]
MSKSANTRRILRLTQLSVLVALLLIFGFTSIGYIKVGVIEITLNVIPVAIAAVVLGPSAGAICGAVFGLTSFWQAVSGMSAFGAALVAISPIYTLIICLIPRILEGLLTGLIFKGLSKVCKGNSVPCAVSSLCCPLLNTLLFVGSFLLLFSRTDFFASLYSQSAASNILAFFAWFVGLNGAVEAAAGFVISSAASKALLTANKRIR